MDYTHLDIYRGSSPLKKIAVIKRQEGAFPAFCKGYSHGKGLGGKYHIMTRNDDTIIVQFHHEILYFRKVNKK